MCPNLYIDICSPFICDNIAFKDGNGQAVLAPTAGSYAFIVRTANGQNTQKKMLSFAAGQPIIANISDIATPLIPLYITIKAPSGIIMYQYATTFEICTNC